MTNSPYIRTAFAQAALERTPPLIRETLLNESDFMDEYCLTADAILYLKDAGVSFQRSNLLGAIRNLFSGAPKLEVSDTEGQKWDLEITSDEGKPPKIALLSGKRRFILPDYSTLSLERSVRLNSLDAVAQHVNLPAGAHEAWLKVLQDRPLTDDEIDEFHRDISDTPVEQAESIKAQFIKNREIKISSLVPHSRRYFERLVGAYNDDTSIRDYAAGGGRALLKELSAWRPYEGFLIGLLLSSHSSLTSEINIDPLSGEDLLRAYGYLENHGDRLSQLGAIEVGLRVLSDRPEIEEPVMRLIEMIRDDNDAEQESGFRLLSALFVLVDGELSRIRLFAVEPPFYRRLAALAHAALIYRQLVKSAVNINLLWEWVTTNRGQTFYLQSLIDLRREPRWGPDLGSAQQLREEFFGRIMIATKNLDSDVSATALRKMVLGTGPGSLFSLSNFPLPYLPGPLEGAEHPQNALPSEILEAIETQLRSDQVGPASFIALVNSSLIFPIDSDMAKLAAKALKLANYRLANIEDKSQLVTILHGLATVAAVTRSRVLADELRILVRKYRRDREYPLSIEGAVRIGLVAAASSSDLNGWTEFSGDWLTELAFQDLNDNEDRELLSHLNELCHVAPELWVTCGRADAALRAFNSR